MTAAALGRCEPVAPRTPVAVPLRPRAVWGLAVGYRRLSLNQLNGRVMDPWQWRTATALTMAGRAGLLGLLVGVGLVLRGVDVVSGASAAAIDTTLWVLLVVAAVTAASSARPAAGLALRNVADRAVLHTLGPLSSGQYVLAGVVVPKAVEVVTLAVAAAAVALPLWGPTATAALAVAAVTGGALIGSVVALVVLAALALVPARAGRARALVSAAVVGLLLGAGLTVAVGGAVAAWRGSSVQEVGVALQRAVVDAVLRTRPPGWAALLERGAPALLGVALLVAVVLVPAATVLLRHLARRHVLAPVGPVQRRGAPRITSTASWRVVARAAAAAHGPATSPGLVRLLVAKDRLALTRLGDVAAGPLRRAQLLGAGATGAGVGFALAGGRAHAHQLTWVLAGFVVLVLGVVSSVQDDVVPVAGIEAERRAWHLLRSAPVPRGSLLVAKAVSVAAQVAVAVGLPLVAWSLALARSAAEAATGCVLVALLCGASGAGAVTGAVLARRTEGSAQETVDRDPLAMVVHTAVVVLAALPVVVAASAVEDGSAIPALVGATTVALLVALGALVAGRDTVGRRWR